jgi:hypothetical protein
MHFDLGYIDLEQKTLQTIDNPFGSRLSPMSSVRSVTHVSGRDMTEMVEGTGLGSNLFWQSAPPANGRMRYASHASGPKSHPADASTDHRCPMST